MDERAWAEYRSRLRTRTGRQMALLICPFVIAVSILKILEPTDYPAGDIRNEVAFRLAFYGLFIAIAVIGFVSSARWLLAKRRAR